MGSCTKLLIYPVKKIPRPVGVGGGNAWALPVKHETIIMNYVETESSHWARYLIKCYYSLFVCLSSFEIVVVLGNKCETYILGSFLYPVVTPCGPSKVSSIPHCLGFPAVGINLIETLSHRQENVRTYQQRQSYFSKRLPALGFMY